MKSRLSHCSHGGFASTYSTADSLWDKAQHFNIASSSFSYLDGLGMAVSACITSQPANKYLDTTSSETYTIGVDVDRPHVGCGCRCEHTCEPAFHLAVWAWSMALISLKPSSFIPVSNLSS